MRRSKLTYEEIRHRERDLQLNLEHPGWPLEGCPIGGKDEEGHGNATRWQRHEGHLKRWVSVTRPSGETIDLWEAMVRFPNAPIYGLHRRLERQPSIEGRSNFHTMRILGHARDVIKDTGELKDPVENVYLLHNGLNETSDFDLHYQLASQFLERSRRPAVCIIRPFPSHLTRYPYSDMFAEKPLDTFLLDSGDLFRQFVRFMVETRWLLSILVPRASYNVITGGKLVECDRWGQSPKLAGAIVGEWQSMYRASPTDKRRAYGARRRPDVTTKALTTTIDVLRNDLLRWNRFRGNDIPKPNGGEHPAIHVVGYSLGSFLAQSAFFSWPYAISGCVSLFGGGELRRLAPTAFAQPEEWQSVLHALRYELDRALRGPQIPRGGLVQGIDEETFEYLRRVFYEVFLQYYQGSYTTRLAEFVQRMLFVTGGQDPIVKPHNVLDAAPAEGVNLINIAGMSHFPMKPKERVQREQREFWIKQLGHIVPAFAVDANKRRLDALGRSWLNADATALDPRAKTAYETYQEELDEIGEPVASGPAGAALSDRWFGKEIERICGFVAGGARGWVLVSRNEVPPVFQTEEVMKRYAAGLHHSEDLATDEFMLAAKRRAALLDGRDRVTLMITDRARETAFRKRLSVFPPRGETPGVARLSGEQRKAARTYFTKHWLKPKPAAVRQLRTGEFRPEQLGEIGPVVGRLQELDDEGARISVRFLPDVWIGFSAQLVAELLEEIGEAGAGDEAAVRARTEAAIVAWGTRLARERTKDRLERRDEIKKDREKLATEFPDEARLKAALKKDLAIVEFSRAGLNPRYRGQRVVSARDAAGVLIHWALAYEASGTTPDDHPTAV